MASPVPEPIEVPKLNAKLLLLYGAPKGPKTQAELAALFPSPGKRDMSLTERAIRNWIDGQGKAGPNRVPYAQFPRLVEVFRKALPHDYPDEEIRRLLCEPEIDLLERAFLTVSPKQAWAELCDEAPPAQVELVPVIPRKGFHMIVPADAIAAPAGLVHYPVGRQFTLRLHLQSRAWLSVMQTDGKAWRAADLVGSGGAVQLDPGQVSLPVSGVPLLGQEAGHFTLVFIMSERALPEDILERLRGSLRNKGVDLGAEGVRAFSLLPERYPDIRLSRFDIEFDAALQSG